MNFHQATTTLSVPSAADIKREKREKRRKSKQERLEITFERQESKKIKRLSTSTKEKSEEDLLSSSSVFRDASKISRLHEKSYYIEDDDCSENIHVDSNRSSDQNTFSDSRDSEESELNSDKPTERQIKWNKTSGYVPTRASLRRKRTTTSMEQGRNCVICFFISERRHISGRPMTLFGPDFY